MTSRWEINFNRDCADFGSIWQPAPDPQAFAIETQRNNSDIFPFPYKRVTILIPTHYNDKERRKKKEMNRKGE